MKRIVETRIAYGVVLVAGLAFSLAGACTAPSSENPQDQDDPGGRGGAGAAGAPEDPPPLTGKGGAGLGGTAGLAGAMGGQAPETAGGASAAGGGAAGAPMMNGVGGTAGGGAPQCPQGNRHGNVSGVEPEAHSHHPPMMDGRGNLYRVTESEQSDGNNLRMMKSSDGGVTWTEVDRNHRPQAVDIEGAYQVQGDGVIHVSVSVGKRIYFTRFNTSDNGEAPDTWVEDEHVDDELGSGIKQYSSLARTSDGLFVVAYSDKVSGGAQQIAYRWRTGPGTYGPKIKVGTTTTSFTGPRVTAGRDGTAHLVYKDDSNDRLYWRKLSSDGAMSDPVRIDKDGTSDVVVPHVNPLAYQVGGEEVVAVVYADGNDRLRLVQITDGQVGEGEMATASTVLQNPDVVRNEGAVATLVRHGTTLHVAWTDAQTGDIRHRARDDGGRWGNERVLWDSGAGSAWYVYCSVVTTGNCPRLACTHDVGPHADDAGMIVYSESKID